MQDYTQQVDKVIQYLNGKQLKPDSEVFNQAIQWVKVFPHSVDEVRKTRLLEAISTTFAISRADILAKLADAPSEVIRTQQLVESTSEAALEAMLPKDGWFSWYVNYTRGTESPMAFHIFASLCALGAALGRRVYKDKGGFFKIYPNYCSILIGPTGRVMKTSAVDIASNLIKETVLCPVMADAITPESLVEALTKSGHHFIYAPEFSVFFGRQRYNEGLTTLMLRLLDCPSEYTRKTLAHGEITVTDLALTVLGGSTLSLLSSSTPEQVTSSGFLNRFVLVVENDTSRSFPEPVKGDFQLKVKMLETLQRMKAYRGEVIFDPYATKRFEWWYNERKKILRGIGDEMTAEVIQRGPVHLERTAILTHLAHCDTFAVCERCLRVAENLMGYVELRVPQTVAALSQTTIARDVDYVLTSLERAGGLCDRSTLMRRVSSRMNKTMFDSHMATLVERREVRERKQGLATIYVLERMIHDAVS